MTRLGRYEIEGEIGRGSMGVVYLALDPHIRRRVAVKTISLPDGLSSKQRDEFRARFLREAQAAGSLAHPGIVTIYGVEETDDRELPLISMEYVAGRNLQHIIQTEGRLVPERAFQFAMTLAEALQAAHAVGIVHRDIKPANILVRDSDGAVKITDFGVARVPLGDLTEGNGILGSPSYMAPEQIRYGIADHRSDLFALAVILWETLSGERLYAGEDLITIGHRIVTEPIPSITARVRGLPSATDEFFERALAKDPARRFENAAAFREAINELLLEMELDRMSTATGPNSPFVIATQDERLPARATPVRRAKSTGDRRVVVAGAVLVLLALCLLGLREILGDGNPEPGADVPAGSAPEASTHAGDRPFVREPQIAETGAQDSTGAAGDTVPSDADPIGVESPGAGSSSDAVSAEKPAQAAPPPTVPKPAKAAPTKPASVPTPTRAAEVAGENPDLVDPGTESGAGAGAEADPAAVAVPSAESGAAPVATIVPEQGQIHFRFSSRVRGGTLVVLIDGEQAFTDALEAAPGKFRRVFRQVTRQSQEVGEETLEVTPGPHRITARLTIEGKSAVSESSLDVDVEAGGTQAIRISAGKKFGVGDALTIRVED